MDRLFVDAANPGFAVDHGVVVLRPAARIPPSDLGLYAHLAEKERHVPVRPFAYGGRGGFLPGVPSELPTETNAAAGRLVPLYVISRRHHLPHYRFV